MDSFPPLEKVQSAQCTYHLTEQLGQGAYGCVWKAKSEEHKRAVAIKLIPRDIYQSENLREVEILQLISHENVVPLLDHGVHCQWMFLAFPVFPLSLRRYFKNNQKNGTQASMQLVRTLAKQLFRSLAHIHSINIIHRDIKPENILLTPDAKLILIDFGIATTVETVNQTDRLTANTLWYRPLEVLLGHKAYDQSVDVWAAACCIFELCLCQPLFSERTELEMIFKIFQTFGTPTHPPITLLPHFKFSFPTWPRKKLLVPEFTQLINKCFDYNPDTRITASQALNKFF